MSEAASRPTSNGARLQRQDGDQRQRDLRDLAADLADGVGEEELAEVEVGEHPEPVAHGCGQGAPVIGICQPVISCGATST